MSTDIFYVLCKLDLLIKLKLLLTTSYAVIAAAVPIQIVCLFIYQ